MRADALGQYLAWKKWRKWLVLIGDQPSNQGYAAAIRRAASRYAAPRSSRNASSISTPATAPLGDGPSADPDADPNADAKTRPSMTSCSWPTTTRPSANTSCGARHRAPSPSSARRAFVAVAWHRSFEQYGGVQLQNRFRDFAHRIMTERDYLAWLGVRIFGEAVTRSNKTDAAGIRTFLVSKFTIAAFKGQALSFRTWDRQLRQPVLLSGPRPRLHVSAGRIPAREVHHRHARLRQAGNSMQAARPTRTDPMMQALIRGFLFALPLVAADLANAGQIFVSNERDNTVTVLDMDTLKVIKVIPTGKRPRGIIITPDYKEVIVCIGDDNRLDIIDAEKLEVVKSYPASVQIRSCSPSTPRANASTWPTRTTASSP